MPHEIIAGCYERWIGTKAIMYKRHLKIPLSLDMQQQKVSYVLIVLTGYNNSETELYKRSFLAIDLDGILRTARK